MEKPGLWTWQRPSFQISSKEACRLPMEPHIFFMEAEYFKNTFV